MFCKSYLFITYLESILCVNSGEEYTVGFRVSSFGAQYWYQSSGSVNISYNLSSLFCRLSIHRICFLESDFIFGVFFYPTDHTLYLPVRDCCLSLKYTPPPMFILDMWLNLSNWMQVRITSGLAAWNIASWSTRTLIFQIKRLHTSFCIRYIYTLTLLSEFILLNCLNIFIWSF